MSEDLEKFGFIIMPFREELDWLRHAIVAASVSEGVKAKRGDDVFTSGAVLEQILADIDAADVVFVVCTGMNANVYFELGYAWRDHTPILIADNAENLPFNIRHLRTVIYGGKTSENSSDTLQWRLRQAIKSSLAEGRIPRGKRLQSPPSRKEVARLTAALHKRNRGSYDFVLANDGTVTLTGVDVAVPEEASSFSVYSEELPIDEMRPGDRITLHAFAVMGGGKSIFDVTLRGHSPDGNLLEFKSKISI
ncbi:hypothetical protein PV646_36785 [Streptomyces sp. ID05-26A]|nr:hypothetical protein [Streptomyces sp. ID05-26A]